jgi:hypothetical protein
MEVLLIVLAVLMGGMALLAPVFGADTRDGRDWQPSDDGNTRWRWR